MAKFVEIEEPRERCVLVGVDSGDSEWTVQESLDELERLADTDGADSVGRLVQRLRSPYARTYLGSGKIEELAQMCRDLDAKTVIFDEELSPTQQANIETLLGGRTKVIDRTALILDIFGTHARTHEGKLQVQMAQLQYLYPRLRGIWSHLVKDKTRGGIGSRFGQGESQLEVDRRMVRDRIAQIRRELKKVSQNRDIQRKVRSGTSAYAVALAGYTNAGKSTLLNALSGSDVYVQDQLFATLDPTTRTIAMPGGRKMILTDTVGFIQKLPTTLVESFKSTLLEVRKAQLILEVADATDANVDKQIAAVEQVLAQIEAQDIRRLVVFNKIDALSSERLETLKARHPDAVFISAKEKIGLEELQNAIIRTVTSQEHLITALVPFDMGSLLREVHEQGSVLSESYENEGVRISATVPSSVHFKLKQYEIGA